MKESILNGKLCGLKEEDPTNQIRHYRNQDTRQHVRNQDTRQHVGSLAEKVKLQNVMISISKPIDNGDNGDNEDERIEQLKTKIKEHEKRQEQRSGLKRLTELSRRTTLASFAREHQLQGRQDPLTRIADSLAHIRILSSI